MEAALNTYLWVAYTSSFSVVLPLLPSLSPAAHALARVLLSPFPAGHDAVESITTTLGSKQQLAIEEFADMLLLGGGGVGGSWLGTTELRAKLRASVLVSHPHACPADHSRQDLVNGAKRRSSTRFPWGASLPTLRCPCLAPVPSPLVLSI